LVSSLGSLTSVSEPSIRFFFLTVTDSRARSSAIFCLVASGSSVCITWLIRSV
jgi:hypothetical protein